MQKPDMDAIEERLSYTTNSFVGTHEEAAAFFRPLLAYARHLEAENKRLRERALAAEQVIYEELPT